jgi:importin-9
MFVDELGEDQILSIAPSLVPELLSIANSSSGHSAFLRRRALSIFRTVIESLELAASLKEYKNDAMSFVGQIAGPWMLELAQIVSKPAQGETGSGWGLKEAALSVLVRLTSSFGKLCAPYLPSVLAATWSMLTTSLPLYLQIAVRGDDDVNNDNDEADEVGDGDEGPSPTIESAVSQLLEFILTVACNRRFAPLIKGSLNELVYIILGYTPLTVGQVDTWVQDAGAFMADEEADFGSVRVSVDMLLDELVEVYKDDALSAILVAVPKRLEEAMGARSSGDGEWWKLREGGLGALGGISDTLLDIVSDGRGKLGKDIMALLQAVLQSIIQNELTSTLSVAAQQPPPLLVGRALWTAARLHSVVPEEHRQALLQAAAAALSTPGIPASVHVCACKSIAKLIGSVPPSALESSRTVVFSSLAAMLRSASEDTVHLVLEALRAVIKADQQGAVQFESGITEPVLTLWANNITDPLISEDATDVLEALAEVPACLPHLQSSALPSLAQLVSTSSKVISVDNVILVTGAIELLTMLLVHSQAEAAAEIHGAVTSPILSLTLTSVDEAIIEAGSSYLRTVLQVGGASVLNWQGVNPGQTVESMLMVVRHLLEPRLGDFASSKVGGLLMELIRCAGPLVGPHLPSILESIANKLVKVDYPATIQSLVCVIAHLIMTDVGQVLDCLAVGRVTVVQGVGNQSPSSSLSAVMDVWTQRQMEIRTPYDIKLTTAALSKLLMSPHPALDTVMVKGRRTDTDNSAIRTRSRSKTQQEEWSYVPLRIKILMLLIDAYIETTTQDVGNGFGGGEEAEYDDDGDDDSGSDWEEDGHDDGDERGGGGGDMVSGWSTIQQQLGGLYGLDDDDDEVGEELSNVDVLEAKRRATDPLNDIDLVASVKQVFQGVAGSASGMIEATMEQLSETQRAALRQLV